MTEFIDYFDDDECNALFDSASDVELANKKAELHAATIRQIVWQKIEELGISIAIGQDPKAYDQDFEKLVLDVADKFEVSSPDDDETEEEHQQTVHAIAQNIWDYESRLLFQITQNLDSHLYGNLPLSERLTQKKMLMAYMIAGAEEQQDIDEWLPLIDATFEGEALDLTNPDDLDVMTKAFDIVAHLESLPEAKLCQAILILLDVPEIGQDAPSYSFEELEVRTFAARDITEVTLAYSGAEQLPNRQAMIHDIVREYDIDHSILPAILATTDGYVASTDS